MGALLVQTIPLALGAAISPVLFLLQLTTLTGQRPVAAARPSLSERPSRSL